MKQIEYRAYHTNEKRMTYYHDGWNENTDVLSEIWKYFKEYGYVLMQYIGTKDKNNQKIYEEDIVKFRLPESFDDRKKLGLLNKIHIGIVKYDDDECKFYIHPINAKKDETYGFFDWDVYVEVIGNTFENEKLYKKLKGKNK